MPAAPFFATHLLEQGADPHYIREMRGHGSQTTMQVHTRYASRSDTNPESAGRPRGTAARRLTVLWADTGYTTRLSVTGRERTARGGGVLRRTEKRWRARRCRDRKIVPARGVLPDDHASRARPEGTGRKAAEAACPAAGAPRLSCSHPDDRHGRTGAPARGVRPSGKVPPGAP
jgi:hypothetical protein